MAASAKLGFGAVISVLGYLALAAWGWGGVGPLLAHPARVALLGAPPPLRLLRRRLQALDHRRRLLGIHVPAAVGDVGTDVGGDVGVPDGFAVGTEVGTFVGGCVGSADGFAVGDEVGTRVGDEVGLRVGLEVGTGVGTDDGRGVGIGVMVGTGVGSGVGTGLGKFVPSYPRTMYLWVEAG